MESSETERLKLQAERYASTRDWAAAENCYLRILEARPRDAQAWIQLSYVQSLSGQYRAAASSALKAANADTHGDETSKEILARLRTFNAIPELDSFVGKLKPLDRISIPMLMAIAAQFSNLNLQERAIHFLDEALRGDPDFPPALLAHGQVLMYQGRMKEAQKDIERALSRGPHMAQGWWLLSRLGMKTDAPGMAATIRREISRPGRRPGDVAMLGHALHGILDEAGQIDPAWQGLDLGNRAKRSTLRYSHADSRALVDALISRRRQDTMRGNGEDRCVATPIFIIGMHRSGTTLLEQMLDGHPSVHGAGELYDFTSAMRYQTDHHCQGVIDQTIIERAAAKDFDFKAVGARYLDGVAWRLEGKPYFTDKLPSNFLNAGFICQALPQARLLHMVRDPIEVCFSNLRELFSNANPYSYDQIELADFYLQYHRLMAHWRQAYPGRILDIRYDRLVRDPETVIREVCDFSGLEFAPEMLAIGNRKRGVSTASAVQVREGIQVRDVPKWKPYEGYLQPMINRLREGGALD